MRFDSLSTTATVSARVQAGIDDLQDYFSGMDWVDRINLDELELASSSHCILGQVFGDYVDGREDLFGMFDSLGRARDRGFTSNGDGDWDSLQTEWVERITEIRAERNLDALRAKLTDTTPSGAAAAGYSITEAAAQPVEFGVSTVREDALIAAAQRGIVDLFLLATGRPESDRTLVTALLG